MDKPAELAESDIAEIEAKEEILLDEALTELIPGKTYVLLLDFGSAFMDYAFETINSLKEKRDIDIFILPK